MHVAAFIGELQHYKNFKPSYLSIGKLAIRPFLSDQVTYYDHNAIIICISFPTSRGGNKRA